MKYYDWIKCKDYIEKNKEDIDYVELGMKEDWNWTSDIVYYEGKFTEDYADKNTQTIRVNGITNSCWATPVMVVHFKNEDIDVINCYYSDGVEASEDRIRECKLFAGATGGLDSV